MDSTYAIETHDLTKRYADGTLGVNGLSLSVRQGEIYGFLGPNGSGKTTTLRMLLGLAKPTAGTATVLGAIPGSSASLARIGAIIETPAFYPYLSGRDNLRVLAGYTGSDERRIEDVLTTVDLASRGKDKFQSYSLGMKQRLGVAAALLKDPALLILDEPTNGLDPAGMADMRDLIRALCREGRTVLISSHLMGEIEQVCDRVGVILRGRLVAEGSVNELRDRDRLIVCAEPIEQARRLIATVCGVEDVTVINNRIHVDGDPASASDIARKLVLAGINLNELRIERASLEDIFLQLTRDEEIAA